MLAVYLGESVLVEKISHADAIMGDDDDDSSWHLYSSLSFAKCFPLLSHFRDYYLLIVNITNVNKITLSVNNHLFGAAVFITGGDKMPKIVHQRFIQYKWKVISKGNH